MSLKNVTQEEKKGKRKEKKKEKLKAKVMIEMEIQNRSVIKFLQLNPVVEFR